MKKQPIKDAGSPKIWGSPDLLSGVIGELWNINYTTGFSCLETKRSALCILVSVNHWLCARGKGDGGA